MAIAAMPGGPASLPLSESDSVTLDGSGNGTVKLRPRGETWYPALASVSASSNTSEAQCRIYCGPTATAPYFVDGTLSGSTGDSTDRVSSYKISARQTPYIFAVWTGGDAGAVATLTVSGTKGSP